MAAKKAPSKTAAPAPGKGLAARRQTTDMATIDAEMAQDMARLKETIGQSAGNRLKLEVTGSFTTPDGMDLGNEIKGIVIDYMSHNKFYTTPFNKDNPTPPDCYAIGKNIAEMAPEADSPQLQNPKCGSCWANQFNSAQTGAGKACQNRRHVALLVIDENNPDAHNAPDAPIYILDLAPTSLQAFDAAVSAVARALNGPPVKAILTLVGKNHGTFAKVSFVEPEPNPDYALHYSRKGEVQDMLTRKPDFAAYEAKAAAQPKGRGRAAPAPARRAAPAARR